MEAGVEPRFQEWDGQGSLVAFVVSLNLHRRHLDTNQRAMVAARIATLTEGRPSKTASIEAVSQDDAADLMNVGRSSVQRAREVLEEGAEELIAAVDQGDIAVSTAAEVASLPIEEQQEVVAKGEEEILRVSKEIKRKRREKNRAKRAAVRARQIDLPTGKYHCIVIDPPWPMRRIQHCISRARRACSPYPPLLNTLQHGNDGVRRVG